MQDDADARVEENRKLAEAKRALRQANLAPERPDASFLRALDSSIKRNTTVIKKLKQINEDQKEGLLEELRAVNLSKFVSEAVAAICDAKLKGSDINAAVQICSLLHQRYKDFSLSLIQGLLKTFFPGKVGEDVDGDRSSRAMRKRSTLKFLMELYYCGVFEDTSIFLNIIKDFTNVDNVRDRETTQTNLSLLVSFARQGRSLLGLPLGSSDVNEELYKELSISGDQKKALRRMLQSFYDASVDLLQSEHSSLRLMEQENARMLNAKGELSEENASAYEKLRKSYEHLFRNVSSLAEALDTQPPIMPEDGHTTRVTIGEEGMVAASGKDLNTPEPIWDDEDTRSFYESLPDLRAFVPAVLLGETETKFSEQLHQRASEQELEQTHSAGVVTESKENAIEIEQSTGDVIPSAVEEKSPSSAEKLKEKSKEDQEKDRVKENDRDKVKEKETDKKSEKDNEKEKLKVIDGANIDLLLQRLPGCVSRDLIDQLTVDFCYVNSKSNRKKLVRALFNVPRTSLELLPYYSRLIATLNTCMRDVAPSLIQMLEEEFNFLLNKKDQMNIETKIRNIRFLGELAKFKVVPPGLIFSCLKSCLDDFTHHNIDVACNLLETCGRFLYRSPETSLRMGNMLEIIMRLKNVKNLDARHSTLVENVYYQCKPPERSAKISKVRSPLQQYIRKLLFSDLDKSSIEHVLRQLRKLPWGDCDTYLLKCFMKVHKGKYSQVHLIASLTAGLSRYHDSFAVAVVDEVLEQIRVGMELNEYGMQQQRIAFMRFLGELYNYRLIDSCVVFETLYLIIFYGYGSPEQDVLDPPEDCFRIRMVITLLETCGHFFDRGSSKRRLDHFLLYFQRYILCKGPIPLDVEFNLQDLFADLRPKMARYSSFEEVNQAIGDLEEKERSFGSERTSDGKYDAQGPKPSAGNGTGLVEHREAGNEGSNLPRENGIGLEEGESEVDTESGSIDPDVQEEDEELDEDKYVEPDDDGDDDVEEEDTEEVLGSEEEDHVTVKQKEKIRIDPVEEAEFEKEFRALMQESVESRKLEVRSRPTINMMIPMNLFEGYRDHSRAADADSGDEVDDERSGESSVTVRVLVKKGSKQQVKQLHIPRDSSLVQSTKQKEAAELEEKQDIKRLVLEYNEREEEERAVSGGQSVSWPSSSGTVLMGRGSGAHGGWDSGGRHSSRQRRPVAAGYSRRR